MIKSLLLGIALTLFSFSGFSWTKIIKENGGFLGYKTVTESTSGPNTILACTDPGRTKCKGNSMGVLIESGGEIVALGDYDAIEEEVMRLLTDENTSGSFYVGTTLYVTYSYNADAGRLVMEIYSLYEAQTLGLI